ncbi:lipase family protein [Corynebacterium qintianiae]|uniref:lipase family protein n=1 Tax=Corynebacterium qintianiae TaxID=2709392 RepID=UPI001F316A6B|nr:lipase family protein [Corynebacterium qintianiae]
MTDIEGQDAELFVGPLSGRLTLDGIRAALRTPSTGLSTTAPVGLIGYSGGAVASAWATQLAPSYAPEINDQIVGSAAGGTPVNILNMINYVDGSQFWSSFTAMMLIGLARGYGIDLEPYLSEYGARLLRDLDKASIFEVNGSFSGITWASLFKPEYRDPLSVPGMADTLNKTNLLLAPDPTVPVFLGQANGGTTNGTPVGPPGIGSGDGVMVTGDALALAHKYCAAGTPVTYRQYDHVGHSLGFVPWYAQAWPWLRDRFDGKPAPSDCAAIPEGNSQAPAHPIPPGPAGEQERPGGIAGIREALSSSSQSSQL